MFPVERIHNVRMIGRKLWSKYNIIVIISLLFTVFSIGMKYFSLFFVVKLKHVTKKIIKKLNVLQTTGIFRFLDEILRLVGVSIEL